MASFRVHGVHFKKELIAAGFSIDGSMLDGVDARAVAPAGVTGHEAKRAFNAVFFSAYKCAGMVRLACECCLGAVYRPNLAP